MRIAILRMSDMRADPRVTKTASALADAGHDVTVFALQDAKGGGDFEADWDLQLVAAPGSAPWRRPLSKIAEVRMRTQSFISAAAARESDVIVAVDSDTLGIAARVARAQRVPFIYDAAELYPDMLISNRVTTPWAVLAYWHWLERRLIPRAAAVITVGEALADELHRRFGVEAAVVRNVPPLEGPERLDPHRLRAHLDLPTSAFVVLYQGLVNRGRGLEVLLHALTRVPRAHLVVQGHGPFTDDFLRLVEDLGLADRVHYMGVMPMDELTAWASGADVGTVLVENLSLNNYLSAPNKLYQYLMAGIPVLGSDFPEIGAVIREGQCGLVCDPSDPDAVARAFRELIDAGSDARATMGARARRLAETKYNWDLEKRRLLEVYERLAAAR